MSDTPADRTTSFLNRRQFVGQSLAGMSLLTSGVSLLAQEKRAHALTRVKRAGEASCGERVLVRT